MQAQLVFRNEQGIDITESCILAFTFRKDAYTPYTSLTARFIAHDTVPSQVTEVRFILGGHLIHHGTVDSLTVEETGGVGTGVLSSQSFTAMLAQNQLEPGLYTNISIDSLMDNMLPIPYVTHEASSDSSGYIYVKKGSTLWDGIVNLCYKKSGRFPYIHGTNCVMFSPLAQPADYSYGSGDMLSVGSALAEKRLVSDLHMADINEQYGSYDLNDPDVTARNIVRHRWFDLDMQFLYDPQKALTYRSSFASRAWRRHFCTYNGYNGEDIGDNVTFDSIVQKPVGSVVITGGRNGIITEISVFNDKFYPV